MKTDLIALIALGSTSAALLAVTASAQTVADPTRPMASLLGELAPVKTGPRASAPIAVAASAVTAMPRLLSVQWSKAGTATALLDGRVVRVGDRLGDASVTAIDGQGLTLRGPRGEQRLPLLIGVTKTASHAMPEPTQALATPKESP